MSFGVGVGDFIAVGTLCWNVYTKCKDSPGNYKQLSGEVSSLYAVIRETELLYSKQTLSPEQQARLDTCRQGCESVLKDLDGLLVKYEGLGTKSQRTFDRMTFGSHDMNEIRLRLTSNVSMLDAFNNASSHEKLEKKLDMLISEVRAGKREGSVVSTRSFGTGAENNRETWDALRRELQDIGISPEIITEKRQFIVAWFQEAVAAGKLEEEAPSEEDDDSIARHGSWSPAGDSDGNSVISQKRPFLAFGREVSNRSSCDVNNLDLPAPTTASRPAIPNPGNATTETKPAAERSVKSTNPQKPAKVEKRSRLSVSYLLSKLRSKDGQLLKAAQFGDLDSIRALLDEGADIEARDRGRATTLVIAAKHGHSQIVQLLIDSGANVNAKTESSETALFFAAKDDKTVDIVQLLLDNNADINATSTFGSPLIVAAEKGAVAVLQLLLDRGANTEPKDGHIYNALHRAVIARQLKSVKVLLENQADIEALDSRGNTALIIAARSGSGDVVKFLLEKGAKIDVNGNMGWTPLHIAALSDQPFIATLLLEYGARTDILDDEGLTPLQLAEGQDIAAVMRVLRAAEKKGLNQLRNATNSDCTHGV